jgi:hypothetical protein
MNGLTLKLKLKQPTPETLPVAPVPAVEDEPPDWELPDFEDEICSLGVLGERVAGQVYKELHTLTEVLPSMDDHQRKYALLDFVGMSGRRLMRLAALIRWSANSWALRKCTVCSRGRAGWIPVTLLAEHCWLPAEPERAVRHDGPAADGRPAVLAACQVRPSARTGPRSIQRTRVRNFDVPTAVDILHSGMYQRLPAVLEVNRALRGPERVSTFPRPMAPRPRRPTPRSWPSSGPSTRPSSGAWQSAKLYLRECGGIASVCGLASWSSFWSSQAADGRAHFHVEDAFTASVTLAGPESTDRWFLLSVDFRASQAEQRPRLHCLYVSS